MTPRPAVQNPRRRCPECNVTMAALAGREGSEPWKAPFVDPADGASLYRCRTHGRVAIYPDGSAILEAA